MPRWYCETAVPETMVVAVLRGPSRRRAPTTRWTIFRRARSKNPEEARRAVAELCEHYQGTVEAYYRDHGADAEQARDLTQGVILQLIADNTFARVDQALGSFRSYLFKAAARHQKDVREAARAQRRNPGAPLLSLDSTHSEHGPVAVDPGLDPEEVYTRRWAQTVLERALDRLHEELCTPKDNDAPGQAQARCARWVWLEPLMRDKAEQGYLPRLAEEADMNYSSLRGYIARMRKRAEELVLEEIGDLVDVREPEAVSREREHLRGAGLRLGEREDD